MVGVSGDERGWTAGSHNEEKKGRRREREREGGTEKSPSTLEKRSFTVVDATVIRNGILRCYSFTTTVAIASSLLRALSRRSNRVADR